VQDSAEGDASGRINTRVLVYDIARDPLPNAPVGHYVVQLPAYRRDGSAAAPDRTAAQSELRAIDDQHFLLLARDGNGLGAGNEDRAVLKQILLVSLAGASNLVGTAYERSNASILARRDATTLSGDIRPAHSTVLIDMLDPAQLARFGLSAGPNERGKTWLSEKWEAMAFVPALDKQRPNDWFLLVGNDNDFIARHCVMRGASCDSPIDNDNRLLAYRLTLPAR